MILRKVPSSVVTRMLSRSFSKSVISKQEFGAWKKLLNRSGLDLLPKNDLQRILPNSSRLFSTSNQRFKEENSNEDKDKDKNFENTLKLVAITTGALIVFNILFAPRQDESRQGFMEDSVNFPDAKIIPSV